MHEMFRIVVWRQTDHAAPKREPDLPSQRHGRIGRFYTGHPQLNQCDEVRLTRGLYLKA